MAKLPHSLIRIFPFNIIGIAIQTSNKDYDKLNADMQSLWQKFIVESIMDKIPDKISRDIYCVYTDYKGDYTEPYTALLGCKVATVDHIPEFLVGRSFSGGSYIKNVASGNLAEGIVFKAWNKIWKMHDLHRAYIADFEVYGEKAQNPQNAEIDIFVGIK